MIIQSECYSYAYYTQHVDYYSEYHTGFTLHFGSTKSKILHHFFQVGTKWNWTCLEQDVIDTTESIETKPWIQSCVLWILNTRLSLWVFAKCERRRRSRGSVSELLCSPLCLYAGTNPSRPGGFPGANSPGPVADLYGPSSQDSAVGNYISAASPQPGSGFGPSITVSTRAQTLWCGVWPPQCQSSSTKLRPPASDWDANPQQLLKTVEITQITVWRFR